MTEETQKQYTNQEALLASGESYELDDAEIPKSTYFPTLPGVYVNDVRTLKGANGNPGLVKFQTNGEFGFNFVLASGLRTAGGRGASDTKYPLTKYINTGKRVVMDFSKRPPEPFLTGRTDPKTGEPELLRASEANRYLRDAGQDPKGLRLSPEQEGGYSGSLLDAIQASLQTKIGVHIDWHEQTTKAEDGTYPEPVLRTSDFKTGTAADGKPIYSPEVKGFIEERVSQRGRTYKVFVPNAEGHTFKARAFVSNFQAVPKADEA